MNIDDRLLQEAKETAVRTNRSLSEIIEEGMRIFLKQRKRSREAAKIRLVTFGEGGLLPGIDLDDSASLLETMDGNDDPL